jgi:hypothetical protein
MKQETIIFLIILALILMLVKKLLLSGIQDVESQLFSKFFKDFMNHRKVKFLLMELILKITTFTTFEVALEWLVNNQFYLMVLLSKILFTTWRMYLNKPW